MARPGVKIIGVAQMHRAFKDYDQDVKKNFERELKDAGDIVATGAQGRFSAIDARSAAGFRSRVKGFGRVMVEQRRRKTTGLRGDYGALQMQRALIPARSEAYPRIIQSVEHMLDVAGSKQGF